MCDILSPNGKKRMKLNLSNSSEPGVNPAYRKKLGIDLSNEECVKSSQKTSVEEKIEESFNNDYVSCVTLDVRKNSKFPYSICPWNLQDSSPKVYFYCRKSFISNIFTCNSTLCKETLSIGLGNMSFCIMPRTRIKIRVFSE